MGECPNCGTVFVEDPVESVSDALIDEHVDGGDE